MALLRACLLGGLAAAPVAAQPRDEQCFVQAQLVSSPRQGHGTAAPDPTAGSNPFDLPEVPEELMDAWREIKTLLRSPDQTLQKDRQIPGVSPGDMVPAPMQPENMNPRRVRELLREMVLMLKDEKMGQAMMDLTDSQTARYMAHAGKLREQVEQLSRDVRRAKSTTEALDYMGVFLSFEAREFAKTHAETQVELDGFLRQLPDGLMKEIAEDFLVVGEGATVHSHYATMWTDLAPPLQSVLSNETAFCQRVRPYYQNHLFRRMRTLKDMGDSVLKMVQQFDDFGGALCWQEPLAKPVIRKLVDHDLPKVQRVADYFHKTLPAIASIFVATVNEGFDCDLGDRDESGAKLATALFSAAAAPHLGRWPLVIAAAAVATAQVLAN